MYFPYYQLSVFYNGKIYIFNEIQPDNFTLYIDTLIKHKKFYKPVLLQSYSLIKHNNTHVHIVNFIIVVNNNLNKFDYINIFILK